MKRDVAASGRNRAANGCVSQASHASQCADVAARDPLQMLEAHEMGVVVNPGADRREQHELSRAELDRATLEILGE